MSQIDSNIKEIESTLKGLISILKDEKIGFANAAKQVEN
jgi:hypothetical protein